MYRNKTIRLCVNASAVWMLLLVGCTSETPEAGHGGDVFTSCGEGAELTVSGDAYCVYTRDVVVEEGFRCPAELPNMFEVEGAGVSICSDRPMVGEEEQREIAEAYVEDNPTLGGVRATCEVLLSVDGVVQFCVYEQEIVEEDGFLCPEERPFLYAIEGAGVSVCSDQTSVSEETLQAIADAYGVDAEDNNSTGGAGALEGEACEGNFECAGELQCLRATRTCVRTCDVAAPECGLGEVCISSDGIIGYCADDANNNDGGVEYRFILLEDTSEAGDEVEPGADIDGVCFERGGNEVACADAVEDFDMALLAQNEFLDVANALGNVDSDCARQNFVSMGGAGSYMILSFNDEPMRPGDDLVVYELGPTVCPEPSAEEGWGDWSDDTLLVSVSDNMESFMGIGEVSSGQNVIPIL